jgi:hypothetical protein
MRVLIGAAVLACALATPALAQPQPTLPANCSGFAAAPTLPDGATDTPAAIQEGNETFTAWHEASMAKLALCRADIEAMRAQVRASEDAYNAVVGQLNATRDAWQVEVTEFNARGNNNSNRRNRGVR